MGRGISVPLRSFELHLSDSEPPRISFDSAVLRDDLYALLATAASEDEAKRVARQLQRVWAETGVARTSRMIAIVNVRQIFIVGPFFVRSFSG